MNIKRFGGMTPADAGLQFSRQPFDSASEVRLFDLGKVELVNLAGWRIGRATYEPGWRWSHTIGRHDPEGQCRLTHFGYVVSGRLGVRMRDGRELEFRAGDALYISPGHDAWTVGDIPCVLLDFTGAPNYPKGVGA